MVVLWLLLRRLATRREQIRGNLANEIARRATAMSARRASVTIAVASTPEATDQLTGEASNAARTVTVTAMRFSVTAGELV